MPKKTLSLRSHHGHQYDPRYRTGWTDVWVRFHVRRRPIELGPCIISRKDIEGEIACGLTAAEDVQLPDGGWTFCLPYVDQDGLSAPWPNICVNQDWVDKRSIEAAIGWYLRERYGFTSAFRIRWRRCDRPFLIVPGSW